MKKAEQKIRKSVQLLRSGKPTQEGIGVLYRMAGFFGQRMYFGHKTKNYADKLSVDEDKCTGCGKCEKLCPMNNMKKIYRFEPWFFMFFGIFHLHRIWGLVDRNSYAEFWINVMESKGLFYFVSMGILSVLCVLGIITFFRKLRHNYWWRWIYLCGGGYLLFDLFAIATGLQFWHNLLLAMFDVTAWYWNLLWGGFIAMGGAVFVLGMHLA